MIETDQMNEVVTKSAGDSTDLRIVTPCNAPAPLVVNGAVYCGCQLAKDHDEGHEVKIVWQR